MAQLVIIVMSGVLATNTTLEAVAYVRQERPARVAIIIDRDREISQYECLVGVPFQLRELVGREVYFITPQEVYGPWLVADVEAKHHAPFMLQQRLIDTNCEQYSHLEGVLAVAHGNSSLR